jgi:tetratricopeptide (TPR) repeat protein
MGDQRKELVARFIAADQLYQRRCFEPALRGFQGCLTLAARQQLKLEFEQLVDLLMWIGRCHLGLHQLAQTLRYFRALDQLYTQLLEIGDLPAELRAAAVRKIDLRNLIGDLVPSNLVFGLKLISGLRGLLGTVYEALADTYQQADQFAQAEDYYQKAIALRRAEGDAATVAKLYMRLAMAQMRRALGRRPPPAPARL